MKTVLLIFLLILSVYSEYNIRKSWDSLITFSAGSSNLAVSNDGKYVYVQINGGYIKRTDNLGINWGNIFDSSTWSGVYTNTTGSRVYAVNGTDSIFISRDYGATHTSYFVGTGSYVYSLSITKDCKIVCAIGGSISYLGRKFYLSRDSGKTFTNTYTKASGYLLSKNVCDSTGKYQIVSCDTIGVLWSTDTGKTFSYLFDKNTTVLLNPCVSYDMRYIYLAGGFRYSSNGRIYRSRDTGQTWDTIINSFAAGFQTATCNFDGDKAFFAACGDGYYCTIDQQYWHWIAKTTIAGGAIWGDMKISADGKYIYLLSNTNGAVFRNNLFQNNKFQNYITVNKNVFRNVSDTAFLYTINVNTLSGNFIANSASDGMDIQVFDTLGNSIPKYLWGFNKTNKTGYIHFVKPSDSALNHRYVLKTGSGALIYNDSTLYVHARCSPMYHHEDTVVGTSIVEASKQFTTSGIYLRKHPGKMGYAFYLNSDSTNYTNSANVLAYNYTQPFTIISWIKRKKLAVSQTIFSKYSTSASRGWYINFTSANKVNMDILAKGGQVRGIGTTTNTYTDTTKYYQYVFVWDTANLRFYVNKTLQAFTGEYGSITDSTYVTRPFEVGIVNGGVLGHYSIDEIKIYLEAKDSNFIRSQYLFDDSASYCYTLDSSSQRLSSIVIDSIRPDSGRYYDSLVIRGRGFNLPNLAVNINGKSIGILRKYDTLVSIKAPLGKDQTISVIVTDSISSDTCTFKYTSKIKPWDWLFLNWWSILKNFQK